MVPTTRHATYYKHARENIAASAEGSRHAPSCVSFAPDVKAGASTTRLLSVGLEAKVGTTWGRSKGSVWCGIEGVGGSLFCAAVGGRRPAGRGQGLRDASATSSFQTVPKSQRTLMSRFRCRIRKLPWKPY